MIRSFPHDDPAFWRSLRRRPIRTAEQAEAVAAIIADVEARGAEAVLDSARRHDASGLESLFASEAEIDSAEVDPDLLDALRLSIERVRDYHDVQMELITEGWESLESGWGWRMAAWEDEDEVEHGMLGQRMLPLRRVGVYAPGGQARYPSSVIMNAVPALAAGVREIVLATPARADGSLDPAILTVCRELGIRQVVKAGGAAAIAALAFGIEGLEEVEKVTGPGSSWVAEAKRQLWGAVGLDMYAGPSEVAVWCLPGADPDFAAADLITQVEHAEDNAALLVCSSEEQLADVLQKVESQAVASERSAVIRAALSRESLACWAEPEQAAEIINRFAPEHLAILGEGAEAEVGRIVNAGAIALGDWTPQSAGDYLSGPSHTLPTSGAARFSSPVSCLDFLKVQSLSSMDRAELAALGPSIERLARHEGFPAHAAGSSLRRGRLG